MLKTMLDILQTLSLSLSAVSVPLTWLCLTHELASHCVLSLCSSSNTLEPHLCYRWSMEWVQNCSLMSPTRLQQVWNPYGAYGGQG